MPRYSQPPPQLAAAISNASRRYGVPVSTLMGIWRIESGGTYPNPYVNAEGYGGLFGTTDWNGPAQEQANLAASILSKLIAKAKGNMAIALSEYSDGGYSSVPGSPGKVPIPSSAPTDLGGQSTITTSPGRPSGGGGDSFWGGLFGDVEHAAGDVWGAAEGAAEGLISGPVDFLKAAVWLLNPVTWLRVFEAVTGLILILAGVGVALGADRALKQAGGPVAAAAAVAE